MFPTHGGRSQGRKVQLEEDASTYLHRSAEYSQTTLAKVVHPMIISSPTDFIGTYMNWVEIICNIRQSVGLLEGKGRA